MKKITLVLGVVASALVLASCASKGPVEQTTVPAQTTPVHHDFKGEGK